MLSASLILTHSAVGAEGGTATITAAPAAPAVGPATAGVASPAAPVIVTPEAVIQGGDEAAATAGQARETDDTSDAENAEATGRGPARARQSPFQTFVAESLGTSLPLFGQNLFRRAPSTFAPVERVPVTADYVIGPGDEILIRAWGQIDVDYRAVVDRNGSINLPRVGVFNVAGLQYKDLPSYLKNAIGRIYKNFELNVSLGALRSIQVFVVGHAARPGRYTVSSLSTLVNTLFASGGPSRSGSMRAIQLKRQDKLITEFDIYDLLLRGDKSKDTQLLPGDVIHIPPVGPLMAIAGTVNVPAIYELKGETSLQGVIDLAGGLANIASGQKVTVERIDERRSRSVAEFPLDASGLARSVKDGDLVRVFPISPQIENAVTLRGAVAAPMRYPWKPGMRIRDLIPDQDALITTDYWRRVNAAPSPNAPSGEQVRREVKSLFEEINWDYAVIERLDRKDLSQMLIPFSLRKAVLEGDPASNLPLEVGDIVTIFSVQDIAVPVGKRARMVRLEGEVARPGIYQVHPGESLRQLMARVGGFTDDAYVFGSEFSRESTRREQARRLNEALNRMERDFEREAGLRSQNALSAEDRNNIAVQLESQRRLVQRLRQVKPSGRIVLDLSTGENGLKDLPDLALEDGDRFFVPARGATVQVVGAVLNENAFIHRPGKTVNDYLAQAGGATPSADESNIYVVRADGTVVSRRQSSIFSGFGGELLMPNDAIIVPEVTERFSWVKELKDWSQIFYQFGLGVAAIKVLRD